MRIRVDSPISGSDAFVFERMTAHEQLGRPYRYDVFLLSANRDLALSPLLGEVISVHVEIAPGQERHFGGHVVRAAALGGHGRSARYQVELRPWLSLLHNQGTCRIWQKLTVVDVLKDVAKKAGFEVQLGSQLLLAGRECEYLVQYDESDFDFFMRLVEEEGLHYYFRQEPSEHNLLLSDDAMLHDSAFADRRIAFREEGSSHQLSQDVFTHWTVEEQMRTTHCELDDYDYRDARGELFVRSGDPAKLPKNGGKGNGAHEERPATLYRYPGQYVSAQQGSQLASVRQQQLRLERQTISARGNVRDLSAGSVFTLFNHPREGQNAKYLVTSMELDLEAAPVESGGGAEPVFRGSYALLRAEVPFRLQRSTRKPSIGGLQTALVVGPRGEEIYTDELGRVKVRFHWDRTGVEAGGAGQEPEPEERSCWVRVAQPWASAGFGFQFIPRIGDEVVVQFLEGDPDRPLVTGSVYNNLNRFPYALPGKQTQSGIKTRSSKQGGADNANEIRFEDEKGNEELFVQAEKNHTVKVKADRAVSVGGNESYSVTGTRDTTITKKNTDTYQDEHKLEVTGKVEEIFHNEHKLDVTGKVEETFHAEHKLDVTGKVEETFHAEHTWNITNKQTVTINNDKTEHITGSYGLTTDTKFLLTQGGTTLKLEGNAVDMQIAAPLSITRGAGKLTIDDSGLITLESALGIVLKCGDSSVEITSAGVAVLGPIMNVNA